MTIHIIGGSFPNILIPVKLFTDTEDPESWMKHAKGLGQLVKMRGPERYRTDLEVSLLKTSRGLIVSTLIFTFDAHI